MDIFVARQPIFDRDKKLFAYELLYRNGLENSFNELVDDNQATGAVLENSFFSIGFKELTEGNRAFVNFNGDLIQRSIPEIFDHNILVVEILEDVIPNVELIKKCIQLKKAGYLIALDDYIANYKYTSLVKIADIIKVDFMESSIEERIEIARKFKRENKILLAEKVETYEDFDLAYKMGYDLFQGYFFSKPTIVRGKQLRGLTVNYLRLMEEVRQEEPDYNKIAEIIESDIVLSYKLLKLVNRFVVADNEIKSIKHALVLLGLREVERWVALLMIQGLNKDKPTEVFKIALFRAKFGEILADKTGKYHRRTEVAMMGMFSIIDTLLDRPLKTILDEIPIAQDIKSAMLGEDNSFRDLYLLIVNYEKGSWQEVEDYGMKCGVDIQQLPQYYMEAIEWTDRLTQYIDKV